MCETLSTDDLWCVFVHPWKLPSLEPCWNNQLELLSHYNIRLVYPVDLGLKG